MKIFMESQQDQDSNNNYHQPKTMVVGVKMDPKSRELLTWALVKVAKPGDHVVALHVIPSNSDWNGNNCSSVVSLVKAFDSVLAVYEGFCNLKQIDLKLRVCRGSSVKKILVREAKSYGATNLIVGINKNSRGIRHSYASIAKYCSKKLSKDCSVLAVDNGKIVFQRECAENNRLKNFNVLRPPQSFPAAVSKPCLNYSYSECSVCSTAPSSSGSSTLVEGRDEKCSKPKKDESLSLVNLKKSEPLWSSLSTQSGRDLGGVKPGWPLLRKAFLSDKTTGVHDKNHFPVVQWAMRLPSRYVSPALHYSDHKHTKFNEEDKAIVPIGRTSSFCSIVSILEDEKELPDELITLQEKYSSVCRMFTYKELKHATSNFSSENLIGRGGSSKVYKGSLSNGKELAVKLLKPTEDALKAFVYEIEIITDLHHKNIISLYGFCFENDNLILVYDFLSRGSLDEILHGNKEIKDSLSWDERYKIAMGVAEALCYLHRGGNAKPVIHRDVKSSNILLSKDFDPQLADFGLALWASSSLSHTTYNDVAGTFGYLAPEYFMYGKVTEKIDVYAFGVVLLELLSGRKAVCTQCPKGEESLIIWAKKILQDGKVNDLVDPCLGGKYDDDEIERMILAASFCIRQSARSRPRMAITLKLLQGDPEILRWARSQVNSSEDHSGLEDEYASPNPNNIQSHINVALLDLEHDTNSVCSSEPTVGFLAANTSLEDYLKGRWSSSFSFD